MAAVIERPAFNPQRKDPCFCNSGLRFKSCCGTLVEPRKPPQGVRIIEDFLSAGRCQELVALAETLPRNRLEVLDLASSTAETSVWMHDPGRITESVELGEQRDVVRSWMRDACNRHIAPVYDQEIEWFEDPRLLRYEAGGRYNAHADSGNFHPDRQAWCKDHDRDVSLLLYLNDDFAGGRLNFTRFNYRYSPKAGDLVFFPSDMRYLHAAETLESGIRYAVVSWMALSGSPRVLAQPPEDAINIT